MRKITTQAIIVLELITFNPVSSLYCNTGLPVLPRSSLRSSASRFSRSTWRASTATPTSQDAKTAGVKSRNSDRLNRARLRLAEAQGRIPPGAADEVCDSIDADSSLDINSLINQDKSGAMSRIWEYNFTRVADASVPYDPEQAEQTLFRQPLRWLRRNVELFVPIAGFVVSVIMDIQSGKEVERRRLRAEQLQEIISGLGPAIIKGGQALASRPDLLPAEYLEELQRLQDRLPPFSRKQALALLEADLGVPFDSVFELVEEEPIAAASIGQVFKAKLVANGNLVAVKIQRPGCEEIIGLDLYIMRFYAKFLTQIAATFGRRIDLVSVIDDFGELIYREIDYKAEAANARRFAELYATIPDVFIPRIYPDLCTSKVLTMEWVEGVRLVEEGQLREMELDPQALVEVLVQCSLRQMLENGFFHADPHAGNLLATPEGKLCYLDFGMMSYLEGYQRYAIIEGVVHCVNRDFDALANLFKRLDFIPPEEDIAPIVVALENALPDVLNASVGELNFKNVIDKLGAVMYEYPFSLPPFYIAIIRCLGVLEGLAIQVDREFRILSESYPYIASRLLTDASPQLQAALRQLLFDGEKPRWERLEQLLEKASETRDYDVTGAVNLLIDYLVSEEGADIRRQIIADVVDSADGVNSEILDLLEQAVDGNSGPLQELQAGRPNESTPRIATAQRVVTALTNNGGTQSAQQSLDLAMPILQRLANEPVTQQAGLDVAATLAERAVSQTVRRLFSLPPAEYSNVPNGME